MYTINKFISKGLLFTLYLFFLRIPNWPSNFLSINARWSDCVSANEFITLQKRTNDQNKQKKIDYKSTSRHVIRSLEKKLKEPKPIPGNATKSQKRTYKRRLQDFEKKKEELERYRRFKTIQKEVAKATNFRSSAVTIRAKKIHEAELAGDSDALDKALKRHIDKSKKIDRQQDDQITHYDSKADDIMEKYFPTSWQHPGRQK